MHPTRTIGAGRSYLHFQLQSAHHVRISEKPANEPQTHQAPFDRPRDGGRMNRPDISSLQAILRSGRLAALFLFAQVGICPAQAGVTHNTTPAGHLTLNQFLDSVSIHLSVPATCLNPPAHAGQPSCNGGKTGAEDATALAYLTRPARAKLRQLPDQPGYLMPMHTTYAAFALLSNNSDIK